MRKGGADGPPAGRGGKRERHVRAEERRRTGEGRWVGGGQERGGLAGRRAGWRVGLAALALAAGRPGAQMRGPAGTWAVGRARRAFARTAGRPGGLGEGAELPRWLARPGPPLAGVRLPCAVHIVSRSCRATAAAASHNPTDRRCDSERCRQSARQEQSACRSLRESCSHEASEQACCQSARISKLLGAYHVYLGYHA